MRDIPSVSLDAQKKRNNSKGLNQTFSQKVELLKKKIQLPHIVMPVQAASDNQHLLNKSSILSKSDVTPNIAIVTKPEIVTKKELIDIEARNLIKLAEGLKKKEGNKKKKKKISSIVSLKCQPFRSTKVYSCDSSVDNPLFKNQLTWLDTLFVLNSNTEEVDWTLLKRLAETDQSILPRVVPVKTTVAKIYPTLEEKRRFKRIKKAEMARKTNQRIKLGLAEPPPTRIKLSALPRVLANNPQMNSSAVELSIRQGYAEREQRHKEHNQDRKLTRTGHKARLLRKLRRDSARGFLFSFFAFERIGRQENLRILVHWLQKHFFNGRLIVPRANEQTKFPVVLMVESGQRSTRMLQRLIERRIQWSKKIPKKLNVRLLWQGMGEERFFADFKVIKAETEDAFAAPFHRHALSSFLKLVLNNRNKI